MDNVPEGQYDNPAEIEPNQKAKNGEEQAKKSADRRDKTA